MQQALPEDLWFFIIIMALLILAFLWRDTASSGNSRVSRGSGGSSTSEVSGAGKNKTSNKEKRKRASNKPDKPETPEEPPDIRIGRRGSTTPGEELWIKAFFTKGTGDIQELKAEINGQNVGLRETDEGSFVSNPEKVQEGENRLKASITTDVATKTDSTTFPAGERVPDDEDGPRLLLNYDKVDEANGHVSIGAEAHAGSAPIAQTAISLSTRDRTVGGNSEKSDYCEFEAEGLPPNEYVIDAVTQDENGLTKEKTETFVIEDMSETDPRRPKGPRGQGGGRTASGIPNIFNPQIEASPEINLDVPDEAVQVLQDIVGEVDEEASEGFSQEVGMEGHQILMAMHMLQNGLNGEDNQQIVEELEAIRESLGHGDVSADALEDSLRSVLHDVFGHDLQDIMEGLNVDGFDEEAIVRAINENSVDMEPLAARLSDIEEAVSQLEGQGANLNDIEARLDSIEEAVEDSGNLDRNAVNPMSMTRDPEESGGEGNKNKQRDLMNMSELDDDVAEEVNDLEQAHEKMKKVSRLTKQIERAESEIDDDIEHIIADLKQARKYDNLIMQYENGNISWNQFKTQLKEMGHDGGLSELKGIIEDARHSLEDYLSDVGTFQQQVADLEEFAKRHREHVESVSKNSQSMRDTVEVLDSLKQDIRRDSDRDLSELR